MIELELDKIMNKALANKVSKVIENLALPNKEKEVLAEWIIATYKKAQQNADDTLLEEALLYTLSNISISELLKERKKSAKLYFEGYFLNRVAYTKMRKEGRPIFYFTG